MLTALLAVNFSACEKDTDDNGNGNKISGTFTVSGENMTLVIGSKSITLTKFTMPY